jgi:hypothetical protein
MNEREEIEAGHLIGYFTIRNFSIEQQMVIMSIAMAMLFEEMEYNDEDVREILQSILIAYHQATKEKS